MVDEAWVYAQQSVLGSLIWLWMADYPMKSLGQLPD